MESEYIKWGGGAGQPVYFKQPDGSWKNVGAPEHGESASYIQRAISDPQVEKVLALYNADPALLNNEQKAFIAGGMVSLDSYGQGYRWGAQNLFDNKFDPQQAGALLQTGFAKYLSPADVAAGQQFNYDQSPAQQAARDDDGGLFGDLTPIIGLAGAAFGAPYLSGLLGGGLAGSLGAGALIGGGTSALTGGDALKGALLGGLGGGLAYGFNGGFGGATYDAGAAMDAAVAQGAANAGTGALGSVTQTFPVDMSTPQLLGNTATGAGGNMSWLSDLAAQDFADFGITGVESLGDALNYSTGAADFTAGISNATQAADFLRNMGMDTNTALGLVNQVTSLGVSPANALKAILGGTGGAGGASTGLAGMLGTAGNLAGGYLNTQAAKEAAQIQANAQIEAAKIAAEAAKFKPVGVTTRFGQSQFGYDDKGNLTSAGYTLTPEMKAQQDVLMATSGGLLNQFQGAQAATAPMGTAAQRAMQLGQGYLATDPAAQAQKYMAEQQALLAPTRERQMASTLQGEFNRGTYGLGTGSTSTGMMAANPRLEALMNAQRQQDLQLASQATQGGMDYAKFGAGMVGTGGDLLKSMYGTQTAAYSPYQTALGGATTIEGLGQNALTQGISLGGNVTAANAAAGGLLAQGMTNAANTVGSTAQQAGSTWGNLLQGAGNWMNKQAAPAAGQTTGMMPMYNPYTGQPIDWSK